MAIPNFTFTRNPSVKVSVATQIDGLVTADSDLTLFGNIGAVAGTAVLGAVLFIQNYGDPVAAQAECDLLFGVGAQLTEMVIAAIKGNLFSDLATKSFPKIKVIPMANSATSAGLAAVLAPLIAVPMPFIVLPYPATDSVALAAVKNQIIAINASDRGDNGQFGSFAFLATDADVPSATPSGLAAATEGIIIPYLRDLAVTKANALHKVAAAYAAVCAGNGLPFLPINGAKVGGLVAPVAATDYLTAGDAGSIALAMDSGLAPMQISVGGDVLAVRSITTRRPIASVEEVAYYDMQDFQVLYYLRKNAYVLAVQPRYKQAKATIQKLQALKSELIQLCKGLEALDMLQFVDKFAGSFTVDRAPTNRHAALYRVPVNIVPGFHNKGIALVGTTTFDSVIG